MLAASQSGSGPTPERRTRLGEAARRPGLHEILSRTIRQGFDADVAFNSNAGRPYDVDATTDHLVRRLVREG